MNEISGEEIGDRTVAMERRSLRLTINRRVSESSPLDHGSSRESLGDVDIEEAGREERKSQTRRRPKGRDF